MVGESYLQTALREFRRNKKLAELAMAQTTDEQFFARPGRDDNSIAIIVKHMAGNMRSRWREFLTTDGEKPDRNRDAEFELTGKDTRDALLQKWNGGWRLLYDALEPLAEADLDRTVAIRGEKLTVLQAINRQLTHYAYHVGQLVFIARHFASGKWETLSVAKGKSTEFNANPAHYVEDRDA